MLAPTTRQLKTISVRWRSKLRAINVGAVVASLYLSLLFVVVHFSNPLFHHLFIGLFFRLTTSLTEMGFSGPL
jgi:hypothetical protein